MCAVYACTLVCKYLINGYCIQRTMSSQFDEQVPAVRITLSFHKQSDAIVETSIAYFPVVLCERKTVNIELK